MRCAMKCLESRWEGFQFRLISFKRCFRFFDDDLWWAMMLWKRNLQHHEDRYSDIVIEMNCVIHIVKLYYSPEVVNLPLKSLNRFKVQTFQFLLRSSPRLVDSRRANTVFTFLESNHKSLNSNPILLMWQSKQEITVPAIKSCISRFIHQQMLEIFFNKLFSFLSPIKHRQLKPDIYRFAMSSSTSSLAECLISSRLKICYTYFSFKWQQQSRAKY